MVSNPIKNAQRRRNPNAKARKGLLHARKASELSKKFTILMKQDAMEQDYAEIDELEKERDSSIIDLIEELHTTPQIQCELSQLSEVSLIVPLAYPQTSATKSTQHSDIVAPLTSSTPKPADFETSQQLPIPQQSSDKPFEPCYLSTHKIPEFIEDQSIYNAKKKKKNLTCGATSKDYYTHD